MKHPSKQEQKQLDPETDKPTDEIQTGAHQTVEVGDTTEASDELPLDVSQDRTQDEAESPRFALREKALHACTEVNQLHPENVIAVLPDVFMHLGTVLIAKRGTHEFYQSWAKLTELHAQAKKGTE